MAASAKMDDVETRIERYRKIEKVGEGTYGVVYKAKDSVTGDYVALKKIRLETAEEGMPQTAVREISVLQELKHPSIVNLLEVISDNKRLYLVFEYCDYDLRKWMETQKRTGVRRGAVRRILRELLEGMLYCHRNRIIHRDLKPQNLLLNGDDGSNLKIADFGLARAFMAPLRTYTHEVVTLWYRAPEVLLGSKRYSPGVDIWSVGCIFSEMVSMTPLFKGDSEIDQLYKIFQVLGTPTENMWPDCSSLPDFNSKFPKWRKRNWDDILGDKLCREGKDLLSKMMAYDPAERISAKRALEHPYFSKE